MTIQWQALKPGDTVRIIAPSAKTINPWEDLKKCCEYLQALELTPVYSETIFSNSPDSYYEFANTDDARYADFVDPCKVMRKLSGVFEVGMVVIVLSRT